MQLTKEISSIKTWAEEDRPREKFLLKGKHSLSDAELLAILIGSGNTTESAVDLCRRILASYSNNLNELTKASVTDLQKFKGIGEAKAITIAAALELGKRKKESDTLERPQIRKSSDAYDLIKEHLTDLMHEEFWIIYLSRSNKVLKKEQISKGGIAGTVVETRFIVKNALDCLASSVILFHNHPSGNREPSQQDHSITKKVKEALKLFDIQLFDHLIVHNNSYTSFADEGWL